MPRNSQPQLAANLTSIIRVKVLSKRSHLQHRSPIWEHGIWARHLSTLQLDFNLPLTCRQSAWSKDDSKLHKETRLFTSYPSFHARSLFNFLRHTILKEIKTQVAQNKMGWVRHIQSHHLFSFKISIKHPTIRFFYCKIIYLLLINFKKRNNIYRYER